MWCLFCADCKSVQQNANKGTFIVVAMTYSLNSMLKHKETKYIMKAAKVLPSVEKKKQEKASFLSGTLPCQTANALWMYKHAPGDLSWLQMQILRNELILNESE